MKTFKIEHELTETELATLLDAINCYQNQVGIALKKENDRAEAMGKHYLLGRYYGEALTHDLRIKLGLSRAKLDNSLMRTEIIPVEDLKYEL